MINMQIMQGRVDAKRKNNVNARPRTCSNAQTIYLCKLLFGVIIIIVVIVNTVIVIVIFLSLHLLKQYIHAKLRCHNHNHHDYHDYHDYQFFYCLFLLSSGEFHGFHG